MPKLLRLDGLDLLRDTLDDMAERLPGWQFRMSGAPEPHPISAVLIEGYNEDLKKHAGIVLLESMIRDSTAVRSTLRKMENAIRKGGVA